MSRNMLCAAIALISVLPVANPVAASDLKSRKLCQVLNDAASSLDDLFDFIDDGMVPGNLSLEEGCKYIRPKVQELNDQAAAVYVLSMTALDRRDDIRDLHETAYLIQQLGLRLIRFCDDYKYENHPKKILKQILGLIHTYSYRDEFSVLALQGRVEVRSQKTTSCYAPIRPANIPTAGAQTAFRWASGPKQPTPPASAPGPTPGAGSAKP